MKTELERFNKLFADHYSGEPWIEINLLQTLDGINEQEANRKLGNLNTIWQIVNHMISWRETLLKRIHNQNIAAPENNFIEPVTDISPEAWMYTKARLGFSQDSLLAYLSPGNDVNLDEHPNGGAYTRYELIQAILQHDMYHLGQVVLIKKLLDLGEPA